MFQYKDSENPVVKYIAWGGVALLIIAPIVFFTFVGSVLGDMGNGGGQYNIISSTPSPDGKNVAIVYAGWGGGAAGWTCLRTTILKADEPFDPELEASDYRYILDIKGGSQITPEWQDNKNLLITYTYEPEKTSTYFRVSKETVSRHTGVNIKYIEKYIEAK